MTITILSGARVPTPTPLMIVVTCGQKVSGYGKEVVAVWSMEFGTWNLNYRQVHGCIHTHSDLCTCKYVHHKPEAQKGHPTTKLLI